MGIRVEKGQFDLKKRIGSQAASTHVESPGPLCRGCSGSGDQQDLEHPPMCPDRSRLAHFLTSGRRHLVEVSEWAGGSDIVTWKYCQVANMFRDNSKQSPVTSDQ